jgi:NAD(P)-dependent dehydrogenase (short-subunit alcohol dehydrogenase family)
LGGDDVSMIMVNVVSLVALTYLFAADMVEQGGGRILDVESTAGFMPVSWPVFHLKNDANIIAYERCPITYLGLLLQGPKQAVYLPTMAFVNSFSQAVDQEMRGKGVCSTVLCPGYVETSKSLGLHSPRNGHSLSKGSSSLAFPTRVETSGDQVTEGDRAKTRRINRMLDQAETVRFPFKKKLTLENMNLLPADIPIKDLTSTSLGNSLRKLSLAGNRLSSIPPTLVICLPALKHLDLSKCELYQLPNKWNLPQLKRLNLSHNRLSEFPDEVWRDCSKVLTAFAFLVSRISHISCHLSLTSRLC